MERIYRKDIEDKVRKGAKKVMVRRPVPSSDKKSFWTVGVRPLGFASLDSMFRNCSYEEAKNKLEKAFKDASDKFKVPKEELKFVKGWRQGTNIAEERLETDEEFEERIQRETDEKVSELREAKKKAVAKRALNKRKIKELEEELERLKTK